VEVRLCGVLPLFLPLCWACDPPLRAGSRFSLPLTPVTPRFLVEKSVLFYAVFIGLFGGAMEQLIGTKLLPAFVGLTTATIDRHERTHLRGFQSSPAERAG